MKRPLRGWRLLLFARCEHASHAESDSWDGPVDADRRWAARLHRLGCAPCRREHREMNWLRGMLAAAPEFFRQRPEERETASLTSEAAARMQVALNEARAAEE